MNTFNKYSQYYDAIYKEKDYKSEVDFIENVITKFSKVKGKKILSLGCGTCSHDILLAKRGFKITGVDQSESMLKIAKEKINSNNLEDKINLVKSDITNIKIKDVYDIVMAMFNVIGYQTTNIAINKTLANANRLLKKNGLLFFDCWYGPAVINDKPTDRIKEISTEATKTIRLTQSALNVNLNVININFHVLEINKNIITSEANETHTMRYWTLPELEYIANNNGFEILKICQYMDLNNEPDEKTWNIFIIAKKK